MSTLDLTGARKQCGLTQSDVAQRMGISQARVSAIERTPPALLKLQTVTAYYQSLGMELLFEPKMRVHRR
ncbi:helix-turn-helix transcriptional regulator [Streptomyces sp. NPDC050738]|uniref:helix-turn-helix domain-containing protein n=1 Tax=Streptomyces sp. NPDC050738 TaxID=3154744 RepID=UPI00342576ED